MKLYAALTVILLRHSHASDLSEKCAANSNAFYWRGSCYVFNPTAMKRDEAETSCNEYSTGHLAFITTPTLATRTKSVVDPLTAVNNFWIGFKETAASSNIWIWVNYGTGKTWQLAPKATGVPMWLGGRPNYIGTRLGGLFYIPSAKLNNIGVTSTYQFLCQYRDIVTPYSGVAMNAKAPADYIMMQMNDTIMERCAFRCNENIPCQSFSHNPTTNHCQLNWWAAIDMTTEFAQGYILFDKE